MRKAMLYEKAQEKYASLLNNDSQRDRAQIGIKTLRHEAAKELYKLGLAYEAAKQSDYACEQYRKALEINSSYNEAQMALARVSGDPFAAVRTLADLGLYTAAEEKFREVVKENRGINVPKDLEYLSGGKIKIWRENRIKIEPWIRSIGEILVVGGIFVLAVFITLRLFKLCTQNLLNPRLDIQDFDTGATELDMGKGLAAMVEVSFKQIGELGSHGSSPKVIAGPIEEFEIPADVKSVHPYIKIVSMLIEWLFPPKVITVSGYLQKPGGKLGAGLTLALVESRTGTIIANRTIWQKDFDLAITSPETEDPTPYYRLAEQAAIWILFQQELWFEKKFTLMGTSDWLSFAYFRAGVRWTKDDKDDKDDKARKLYVESLNQDMNNRGALFNLGALDTEARKYRRAIDRLKRARNTYISDGKIHNQKRENETDKKNIYMPHLKDAVWYKATYQLAATYHYQSIKFEEQASTCQFEEQASTFRVQVKKKKLEGQASDSLNQAEDEAKKLYKAIEEAIKPQKKEDKALRNFLESFRPMATIMYAEILVGTTDDKKKTKAKECIERVDFSKLTYRIHYNLACYYTNASDNKKALYHLKYALERGGEIIQWAQRDPSLKGLREGMECNFYGLIKEYSDPVTPSGDLLPLAGLRVIGEIYAKLLKEQGIVSHEDLIQKANTPSARKTLAEKLGINTTLLRQWALLADLMRIVGSDTQYANLLESANVCSLRDLKRNNSHDLTKLLHQVNTAQSLVKQPPLEETVLLWVLEANIIEPKVEETEPKVLKQMELVGI